MVTSLGDRLGDLPESEEGGVTAGLTRLRRSCVEAKEALSGDTATVVHVSLPGRSTSVRLNRDEFEAMIGPALTTRSARWGGRCGRPRSSPRPAQIVLVGGSSRIPLVSEQLTRSASADRAGHPPQTRRRPGIRTRRSGGGGGVAARPCGRSVRRKKSARSRTTRAVSNRNGAQKKKKKKKKKKKNGRCPDHPAADGRSLRYAGRDFAGFPSGGADRGSR